MRPLAFMLAPLLLAACATAEPEVETDDDAPVFYRGADWAADANPPYSAMVAYDDLIHLAGTLGFRPGTRELGEGTAEQAQLALRSIEANLAQVGAGLSDIVKCTCYLADMGDYAAFNAAYSAFFPTNPPARTTMGVAALPLGAAVEITCLAARPDED